jgi:hypothetical protein
MFYGGVVVESDLGMKKKEKGKNPSHLGIWAAFKAVRVATWE